jgi:alpha,alpha-trehalase
LTDAAIGPSRFDAVILDLDGVITRTAVVHARAWKSLFDDYLERRAAQSNETFVPFDIDSDYKLYVDGKPRYDGVASFLESRDIELPRGESTDPPDAETVCGLGNRKNALFVELLERGGADPYPDAVEAVCRWREQGLRTAVVSSSRNCQQVLISADVEDLFEVRVDGLDLERDDLPGKPHPEMFLEAARRLGVAPARSVVFEDAVSGVEAGRRGGFGLVVGVARDGEDDLLLRSGADVAVARLTDLPGE